MNKTILSKQMLEEQYGTALKGLVECKDDNLILAQVCKCARKDACDVIGHSDTFDEMLENGVLSNLYNEFAHYFAGTSYGKTEEVCKHIEQYGNDKNFVEKLVKHTVHYLNEMAVAV